MHMKYEMGQMRQEIANLRAACGKGDAASTFGDRCMTTTGSPHGEFRIMAGTQRNPLFMTHTHDRHITVYRCQETGTDSCSLWGVVGFRCEEIDD